jgi:hypothetical protein
MWKERTTNLTCAGWKKVGDIPTDRKTKEKVRKKLETLLERANTEWVRGREKKNKWGEKVDDIAEENRNWS